ncbi:MAG TPA: hypothetical protein VK608_01800 [Edaphobacter sp.]|nr:hypothetical protein [Edaphobacter sp.]
MNSAKGEVDDLIGMAEGKTATAAGVTGVGGRAGITLANGIRHSFGVDATDQTASTFHEKFAVPLGGRRQPDFGLDLRIGRRPKSDGNPTVSCGLCCGGDIRQARHVGTPCLGEERGGQQQEEYAHALHATTSDADNSQRIALAGLVPRNPAGSTNI